MANTRRFGYTVRLDSGLIIPAGAAAGRTLFSDASGVATWAAPSFALSAAQESLKERANETAFGPLSETKDALLIFSYTSTSSAAVSWTIISGVGGLEAIAKGGAKPGAAAQVQNGGIAMIKAGQTVKINITGGSEKILTTHWFVN